MSRTDSPRLSCISPSRRTTAWPPSSLMPTSNEIRVRVDGFSKISATLRPVERSRREAVGLQLGGALEQAGQLIARKLLAGEEVPRHLGIVDGRAHRPHVEPLPRARPSARGIGRARSPSTACSATSSRRCSRASRGTSRSCRRHRRTGCARSPTRGRRLGLVGAHLAQLRRVRPPAARRAEPGQDRVRRGRLEPDPRPVGLADPRDAPADADAAAGAAPPDLGPAGAPASTAR